MKIKHFLRNVLLLASVAQFSSAIAVGAVDVPKIKGSTLVAEAKSDYAEGAFFVNDKDHQSTRYIERFQEGKSTRQVYLLQKGQSPLFALRNYQEAFKKLGDVTDIYSCKSGGCNSYLGQKYVWAVNKGRTITTEFKPLKRLYDSTGFYADQTYWYAVIKSEKSTYTVSVYSVIKQSGLDVKRLEELAEGQALVHVQVIEYSDFKSDLEYVKASEIQSGITKSGHIALSGLFFDTGSDQLTAESAPALGEIAKALKASPELKLYVVGHTDNVGSVSSNQDLSARRAKSVAASLVNDYGIASDRFVSIGAGLIAPVTSNKTEEGKALNRRVELVER